MTQNSGFPISALEAVLWLLLKGNYGAVEIALDEELSNPSSQVDSVVFEFQTLNCK